MYFWPSTIGVIIGAIIYLAILALLVYVAYLVIRAAVRSALDDNYRKKIWYRETGLWYSGRPPKGLPGTSQLNRDERKDLPKDEQPEG